LILIDGAIGVWVDKPVRTVTDRGGLLLPHEN